MSWYIGAVLSRGYLGQDLAWKESPLSTLRSKKMTGIKDLAMNISCEMGMDGDINYEKLSPSQQAIMQMKLAKKIRAERFIKVCAWHKPEQAWWNGEEWIVGNIPPGIQTHGICEACKKVALAK